MMTKTTAQHVCFGKVFCGFPREIAQAECPACTCTWQINTSGPCPTFTGTLDDVKAYVEARTGGRKPRGWTSRWVTRQDTRTLHYLQWFNSKGKVQPSYGIVVYAVDELVGEIAADGTVTRYPARRRVPLTCSTCEQSGDALVTGHGLVCEYCDTVTPA